MTVVPSGPLGFLSAWPSGNPQPGSSTLNDPTGTIVANAAIVPAGVQEQTAVFGYHHECNRSHHRYQWLFRTSGQPERFRFTR